METNYFSELNKLNCSDKVEKKNGLSYLSWAWAWGELKKLHPDATYTVYENKDGWNYHTDGRTCWVKTGVTVNGIENIEYLPVMDFKNRSIPVEAVTSFDVNKTIQRSLTKAVARHGLGLYIYAGEDLPEEAKPESKTDAAYTEKYTEKYTEVVHCSACGNEIVPVKKKDGAMMTVGEIAALGINKCGKPLCAGCLKKS